MRGGQGEGGGRVDVPVDDEDAAQLQLLEEKLGGDGDRVEVAEPPGEGGDRGGREGGRGEGGRGEVTEPPGEEGDRGEQE